MPFSDADLVLWEQEGDAKKFTQILAYLTDDEHKPSRIFAARALGNIRDPGGLLPLTAALSDVEEVAQSAEAALKAWATDDIHLFCEFIEKDGARRSVRSKLLEMILQQPSERVLGTILALLRKGEFVKNIQSAMREGGFTGLLLQKACHHDPEVRYYAVFAMEDICKHPEIFDELIRALADENPQVRCLAARTIAQMQIHRSHKPELNIEQIDKATGSLLICLTDDDFTVRAEAAAALGGMIDRTTVSRFVELLADPYAVVRESAVNALVHIHEESLFDRLTELFQTESNALIRGRYLHAIAATDHEKAFGYLTRIVETGADHELQTSALEAMLRLVSLQPVMKFFMDQLSAQDAPLSREILRVCYEANFVPTIKALRGLIQDNLAQLDNRSVYFVIRFLGVLRDRSSVDLLLEMLGNEEISDSFTEQIVKTMEAILHPTPILDCLAALPSVQDGVYMTGVKKIMEYFEMKSDW